ncbi:MAG: type II secretion system protein [Planctomycetota bacterium]|jgi:prepilin-type N-terminal cleavage/methylation domain-containing protein/prepilin-type processing-associated H-X9-DG protein
MCKRKGFTLVELLTVIAVISLLMAILLPILGRARRNAQAGVCLSNLRQWGMVYKMYTDEFDGRLPRDYGEFAWYYPIRPYYSNDAKILLCPTAKKPADHDGTDSGPPFGGTFLAWGHFEPADARPAWDTCGSYGLNHWAYKLGKRKNSEKEDTDGDEQSTRGLGFVLDRRVRIPRRIDPKQRIGMSGGSGSMNEDPNKPKPNRYWATAYARNSSSIPLVFDSSWPYAHFVEDASPPSKDADSRIGFYSHANPLCIDRHSGGINTVFMDFSVRKAGLKELWTLKWHAQYNTAGPWTKAGGVPLDDWPRWMRNYKDY